MERGPGSENIAHMAIETNHDEADNVQIVRGGRGPWSKDLLAGGRRCGDNDVHCGVRRRQRDDLGNQQASWSQQETWSLGYQQAGYSWQELGGLVNQHASWSGHIVRPHGAEL